MTLKRVELDYAQRQPTRWRRRIGLLLLVIAVIVAAALAYRFWIPVKDRIELILAQRRCATTTVAPGTIVFEEDPALAGSLLASGKYVHGDSRVPRAAILPPPQALVRYPANRDLFSVSDPGHVCIFFGKRCDDRGREMIVCAEAKLGLTPGDQLELEVSYDCDSMAPWSLKPMPQVTGGIRMLGSMSDGDDVAFERRELHRSLTLKVGQPDPSDAQRFTVPYAIDRKWGTIAFRVRQLGSIDIEVLDGPLTYANAHDWAERMRHQAATAPSQ